jgi:RNA polymerase sigma factor (TIGR02999 family)
MSDSAPDQKPEPQPKWSGGPPRPPKRTARGFEEDSPSDDDLLLTLAHAAAEVKRLVKLLESSGGSQLVGLNRLETELDERVVEVGKLLPRLRPLLREFAVERCLRTARDYRRRHPPTDTGDQELHEQARKILDEAAAPLADDESLAVDDALNPDAKMNFGELLRLTKAAERAAYLDRVCADNPARRQDIESLLAASTMAREAPGPTLQPTALVDEAWTRLFGGAVPHCPDRAYFFAAVGEAMRRILVENARRKKRLKRGGGLQRIDIAHVELVAPLPDDELLAVDEALDRFAEGEPFAAKLVKLCYFVGLTQEQAAKELGVSLSTVERDLAYARAWLRRELEKGRNPSI